MCAEPESAAFNKEGLTSNTGGYSHSIGVELQAAVLAIFRLSVDMVCDLYVSLSINLIEFIPLVNL